MKSCLDKRFVYTTAAKSKEPNYLRDKFRAIAEQKEKELANVKTYVRAKIK